MSGCQDNNTHGGLRLNRRSSEGFQYKPLLAVLREITTRETFFDIYVSVFEIHANGHAYFDAWKEFDVDHELCEKIVTKILNQEECGQLKGLGLWLLQMMATHAQSSICIDLLAEERSFKCLLSIFLKQGTHDRCMCLLLRIIKHKNLDLSTIYKQLSEIAIHNLHYLISYSNYMDLFHFVMLGIEHDPNSIKDAMVLLSSTMEYAVRNPMAQYNLGSYKHIWLKYLSIDQPADILQATALVVEGLIGLHFTHDRDFFLMDVFKAVFWIVFESDVTTTSVSLDNVKINRSLDAMTRDALLGVICAAVQNSFLRPALRVYWTPSRLLECMHDAPIYSLKVALDIFAALHLPLVPNAISYPSLIREEGRYDAIRILLDSSVIIKECLAPLIQNCFGWFSDAGEVIRSHLVHDGSSSSPSVSTEERSLAMARVVEYLAQCSIVLGTLAQFGHLSSGFDEFSTTSKKLVPILEGVIPLLSRWRVDAASLLVSVLGEDCMQVSDSVESLVLRHLTSIMGFLCGSVELSWKCQLMEVDILDFAAQVRKVDCLTDPELNPTVQAIKVGLNSAHVPEEHMIGKVAGDEIVSSPGNLVGSSSVSAQVLDAHVLHPVAVLDATDLAMELQSHCGDLGQKLTRGLSKYLELHGSQLMAIWTSLTVAQRFAHVGILALIHATVGMAVIERVMNLSTLAEKIYQVFKDHTEFGLEQQCGQLLVGIFRRIKVTLVQKFEARELDNKKKFLTRGRRPSNVPQTQGQSFPFASSLIDLVINRLANPVNQSNMTMLHIYLSILLALSQHEAANRQAVVLRFLQIMRIFWPHVRFEASIPLMHLVVGIADSMSRLESGLAVTSDAYADRIDTFTELVVYALRNCYAGSYIHCMVACNVIVAIGRESPSMAKRCFVKREVEIVLYELLRKSIESIGLFDGNCVTTSSSAPGNMFPYPYVTLLALKASVVCIRHLTMKSNWDLTAYSFPLSMNEEEVEMRRPLLRPELIDALVKLSSESCISHRLLLLISSVEAVTALRLACKSNDQQSPAELEYFAALKKLLNSKALVIIQRALGILIHRTNVVQVNVNVSRATDKSLIRTSSDEHTLSHGNDSGSTYGRSSALLASSSSGSSNVATNRPALARFPILRAILQRASTPPQPPTSSPKMIQSSLAARKSLTDQAIRPSVSRLSASRDSENLPGKGASDGLGVSAITINPVLEQLAEASVEALYAFFCLDDHIPIPMVTYAANCHMFEETPLYYVLEYAMLCYPDNIIIQHRGIEIFACFAEGNINVYSLATHASIVLMISFATFNESSELYHCFAKLALCIAGHSSSIRDKLIRYRVQDGLAKVLLGYNVDAAVMALQSLWLLCIEEDETCALVEGSQIISGALRAMDFFTTDHRVQIEGMKLMLAVSGTPEFSEYMAMPTTIAVLKKARKVLLQVVTQRSLAPGYRYADLQIVLENPLFPRVDGEKCCIS